MAKFCAQCGVPLGPADNFCAGCGKQVIRLCPTCGQDWDGLKREASPTQQKRENVVDTQQVMKSVETKLTPSTTKNGTKVLTSARVQPVYGKEFNSNSDCPNCGTKGNKKSCSVCDYGR